MQILECPFGVRTPNRASISSATLQKVLGRCTPLKYWWNIVERKLTHPTKWIKRNRHNQGAGVCQLLRLQTGNTPHISRTPRDWKLVLYWEINSNIFQHLPTHSSTRFHGRGLKFDRAKGVAQAVQSTQSPTPSPCGAKRQRLRQGGDHLGTEPERTERTERTTTKTQKKQRISTSSTQHHATSRKIMQDHARSCKLLETQSDSMMSTCSNQKEQLL